MKMAEKKPVKKQKEEKKEKQTAKTSHKTEMKHSHIDAKGQKEHKDVHKDVKDFKHAHKETKEMKKAVVEQKEEKGKGKIAEKVDKEKIAGGSFSPAFSKKAATQGGFSPAFSKKAVLHAYQTLIHPLITEKAINMIESENKLVFVVRNNATKQEVKKAVEELYGVKVDSVNIMRDMKARKRAFVRINEKYRADEIATKLGVL